jgi:hypothetical protein
MSHHRDWMLLPPSDDSAPEETGRGGQQRSDASLSDDGFVDVMGIAQDIDQALNIVGRVLDV